MQKVISVILVIGCMLLASCHTPKTIIKEVPVEVTKTEYKDVWHFDSIYLKENVYIYQKGDTVFKDSIVKYYIEKQIHDTLITHDTIPQIVYQDRIIEKKVPQWWPIWLFCGLFIVGGIGYLIYKFKDKIKLQ